MADILIQISENVSQSTAVVSPAGDAIAVNLTEVVGAYDVAVTQGAESLSVNVIEAVDEIAVAVEALTPEIVVNVSEGGKGGGGGVFVTDIEPVSGVIGAKVFVSGGKELASCSADHDTVRVIIGCEGGFDEYMPEVTVNGIAAVLNESFTKRWFISAVEVPIPDGVSTILVSSNTGATATVEVTRRGAGPAVTSIVIGAYPGTQTQLKAGDVVGVTIYTEPDAVDVTIAGGSTCDSPTFAVSGGVATGTITISAASGASTFTATARNDFGTPGSTLTSPALALNQTYPTFGAFSVSYPAGQGALSDGQTAGVTCVVSNADSYVFSGTGLVVDPNYADTKLVTADSTAYVVSGTNYTITATRAANNAAASASTLVKLSTAAPTAAISTVPAGRLQTSPSGSDYEVRITPSQQLSGAPSLVASVGAWQGTWTNMGSYWKRNIRVSDSDARGVATFSDLALSSLSLTPGNVITAGENYTIGGLSARTLTVPAFSRVVAIGGQVSDATKTAATVVGGNILTRQSNNAVVPNGYYIANADGSYNATGTYLGLSDSGFAGSNTAGTLQLSFVETA